MTTDGRIQEVRGYQKQRASFFGLSKSEIMGLDEAQWLVEHPPGYFEHRQAVGAQGEYGKWIRKGSSIVQHENILYLHGGLAPEMTIPIDAINERIRLDLTRFDDYVEYLTDHGVILPFFRVDEMTSAASAEVACWETRPNGPQIPQTKHLDILNNFFKMHNWISNHPKGPLWYRGYAEWSEKEGPAHIEAILTRHGVYHIVVGHTPM